MNMKSKVSGYIMGGYELGKEECSRGCCMYLPGKGNRIIFEDGLGEDGDRSRRKEHGFIFKSKCIFVTCTK